MKKMGTLLQKNLSQTLEKRVNEEIRKFLEQRPHNYEFLYKKALNNTENS